MSLQLVIGNSGSGKSYMLRKNIIEQSVQNPNQQFLLIVPEQFTLETQRDIVMMHPKKGTMNIDILSFERLAYRIFDEVGGNDLPIIDDIGKNLIIRKISQENKEKLSMLGSNLGKIGYITEIKSIISEFTQYEIDDALMEQMLEKTKEKANLNYKLKDIKVLYDAFKKYIDEKFTTSEEMLDVLADVVDKSEIIKESIIFLDGFTGFTPIQNRLMERLLKLAKKVIITVTIDIREDYYSKFNEYQLFAMSKKMIQSLKKIANDNKVEIEEDIVINADNVKRYENNKELSHLEKNLFRYPIKKYEGKTENIKLFTSNTPMGEIWEVASVINKMVKKEGYRYKDIAIVSGNIEEYGEYIVRIFDNMDIPLFIDNKRSILMNPFIEYIRSALQVIDENFSYESMFRYLKSGLSDIDKEDIDIIENYCLAFGIRSKAAWLNKWDRCYYGVDEDKLEYINGIREKIVEGIMPLYDALKDKNASVSDYTKALYYFIENENIYEKLEEYRKYFEKNARLSLAKEYSQIYRIVMELLEKTVILLKDEKMKIREYREILDAGFEEAKVGIIPPSIDCVMAGDIERSRLSNIKILFFIGVNEGAIPKAVNKGGIISQMDRELLKKNDIILSPTLRENAYIQKFYLYLNMTKPKEKLYLSYSMTDFEGKAIRTSYLTAQVRKLFPNIEFYDADKNAKDIENINSRCQALKYMENGLREYKRGNVIKGFKEIYECTMENEADEAFLNKIVDMAFYENTVSSIGKATANALYGNVLENSVTRLERYAQCAYAHFLSYGLELREREEYSFKAMDMGNIFHKVLEKFLIKLDKSEYSWKNLPKDKREEMVSECVNECVYDYANTILQSSKRNEYIIKRINRIMQRTVWCIQSQVEKGKLVPKKCEVSFSMAGNLESINISLSESEKLRLKGRIDRIDSYETSDSVYVRIVDYKSGATSFDIVQLYYGLSLQLVVYMNASMEIEERENVGKKVIPAGILYYNINDPIVENNDDAVSDEIINEQILDRLRMNGLVNNDIAVIRLMDEEFEKKSSVIPVALTKDGLLTKNSSVATESDMRRLGKFVHNKVQEIGKEILEGNVEINPYTDGTKTACDYCAYKGVCGFDNKISGYEFRRLKQLSEDEVWEKIKDSVKEKEEKINQEKAKEAGVKNDEMDR